MGLQPLLTRLAAVTAPLAMILGACSDESTFANQMERNVVVALPETPPRLDIGD